jgi:hypothetical protein
MFVMSVTGAIGNIENRTYLTENVADDMIGKISGISYTMTIGACALGPVFGGYALQESNVQDAVLALVIILALMALASLLVFKKSNRADPKSEPGSSSAARDPAAELESPRSASAPIAAADRSATDRAEDIRNVELAGIGDSR